MIVNLFILYIYLNLEVILISISPCVHAFKRVRTYIAQRDFFLQCSTDNYIPSNSGKSSFEFGNLWYEHTSPHTRILNKEITISC